MFSFQPFFVLCYSTFPGAVGQPKHWIWTNPDSRRAQTCWKTHLYDENALVTEKPGYAPILNPITGKPLGLVSNENGKFFAIDYGENDPDIKTTTELSETTQLPILETTKSINYNHIYLDDAETTTGRHKQPQIDPTLESLTREFMDLVQGEKSAISPPIYLR